MLKIILVKFHGPYTVEISRKYTYMWPSSYMTWPQPLNRRAESLDLLHIARRRQIKCVHLVAYYAYIIIYDTMFGNFSVVKCVK
jgi:hypothetical protein